MNGNNYDLEGNDSNYDADTMPKDSPAKRAVKAGLMAHNSLSLACRLAHVDPAQARIWQLADPLFADFVRQHNRDLPASIKAMNRRNNQGGK